MGKPRFCKSVLEKIDLHCESVRELRYIPPFYLKL